MGTLAEKKIKLMIILFGSLAVLIAISYKFIILNSADTRRKDRILHEVENPSPPKIESPPEEVKKPKPPLGPFPTDETLPERKRKLGIIMNRFRLAIIKRDRKKLLALANAIEDQGSYAIPFLKKLAREDKNQRVRAFAIRALGRTRLMELKGFFLKLLQSDKSIFVRKNCIWALGELKDSKLIPLIEGILQHENIEELREEAKKALKKLSR